MSKSLRTVIVIASFCALVVIVALLVRFVFVSNERRIEMTLKRAIEAVRVENIDDCMACISVSAWDSTAVTRSQIKTLMKEGFAEFDNIRVLYDSFKADVKGKTAVVTIKVKVLAKYNDQVVLLVGTLSEGKEITLGFTKEGKKWRISSVSGIDIPSPSELKEDA
jgi:hypothetical protein